MKPREVGRLMEVTAQLSHKAWNITDLMRKSSNARHSFRRRIVPGSMAEIFMKNIAISVRIEYNIFKKVGVHYVFKKSA